MLGNLHFKSYYWSKIAIMSDKPQTTRNKIQGVYTENDSQVIFIDTPGIHKPKHKLGDFMVKMAQTTLKEVDIVLFMVNAVEGFGRGEEFIIEKLKETKQPVFLVINKIDQVHPEQLLELIDQYRKLHDFAEIVPISALDGNNVEALIGTIKSIYRKEYYPDNQVTDHPERFIIAELIREKVLHLTREEVPHSVAVVIDAIQKREGGAVYINATIVVERPSQKGLLSENKGRC